MQTAPGDRVRHPTRRDWGLGQVQTVDGARVTVNLDHAGKQLIDVAAVPLIDSEPDWPCVTGSGGGISAGVSIRPGGF